jgi:hypothetical protein
VPRAAGEQRIDRIGDRACHHEGDAEQRHLRHMIPAHVHELRNERAEEHQLIAIVRIELSEITKTPANKGHLSLLRVVNYLDDAIFPLIES